MSHTPGPWRTGDLFHTVFGPPNGEPCPEIIGYVHKGHRSNARLIAAAPALLEVCQTALEVMGEWDKEGDPSWAKRAREVIAQAKGA